MLNTIRSFVVNSYLVSRHSFSTLINPLPTGILINPAERKCLARYAARVKNLAVEIGTFKGGSASIISKAMTGEARLVTIDPYVVSPREPKRRPSPFLARLNVLRHGDWRRVRFIRGYSYNIVTHWADPIDLLWIDGNHEYTAVKQDFESWSEFLAPGGYLIFHDSNKPNLDGADVFNSGLIGPTLVSNSIKREQTDKYEHIEAVASMNVFRRKA